MDQRESDPTGSFSGGEVAGTERADQTEYERHAPDRAQPGGGQPNSGQPQTRDGRSAGDGASAGSDPASAATGLDREEREQVIEGMAATSEIADPDAQASAERQGDGTPQPR